MSDLSVQYNSSLLTHGLHEVDEALPEDEEGPVDAKQVEDGVPEEGSLHGLEGSNDGNGATHHRGHEHTSAWWHTGTGTLREVLAYKSGTNCVPST